MARVENPKYKLVRTKKMPVNQRDWKPQRFYQLIALRDIPRYNVQVGDFGGFVDSKHILSHDGDCWIGEEAQVMDNVKVVGDAYVGGHAILTNFYGWDFIVKDRVKIGGNASIFLNIKYKPEDIGNAGLATILSGNAEITDNAVLMNVREVSGYAHIHGNAYLENVSIVSGTVEICDNAEIKEGVSLLGNSKIFGKTVIGEAALIRDSMISDVDLVKYADVSGQIINPDGMVKRPVAELHPSYLSLESAGIKSVKSLQEPIEKIELNPKTKRILAVYQEVMAEIESYETDIVKIIKYPVMTDRTHPLTRAMVSALKDAQHFADSPEDSEFVNAVRSLENAYLAAESNALKLASTLLSEGDRKKMEKAKDLLAIASNEVSTEHEKKVAFQQGFKALEGVIAVPEIAVDSFRVKIGLKELEG